MQASGLFERFTPLLKSTDLKMQKQVDEDEDEDENEFQTTTGSAEGIKIKLKTILQSLQNLVYVDGSMVLGLFVYTFVNVMNSSLVVFLQEA